jgi:GWxTD domain-containing protein
MKFFLITIIFLSSIFSIEAQTPRAYLNYSKFYEQGSLPYIETQMTLIGKSLKFVENKNKKFEANIEITMLFKQNDSIKYINKYNLLSPEINDTLKGFPNFIDLQRVSIKNGTYQFQLTLKDLNNPQNPQTLDDVLIFNFDENTFSFSDVEFIENYKPTTNQNILSKNGYDITPYVSDYFPENIDNFTFYCELYNLDKLSSLNEEILLNYYLENSIDDKIAENFTVFKKIKAIPFYVLLSEFNIEKLPSGQYNLVIEIKNKENKIIQSTKTKFIRSNAEYDEKEFDYLKKYNDINFTDSYANIDTICKLLPTLMPIATGFENIFIENQLKLMELEPMKNFFYNFWFKRNANSPYEAWKEYYKRVLAVNQQYSFMNKKGYETDRGIVYLKYGAPNNIIEEKYEETLYPYEVWTYNEIKGKTNRKFIFYNPRMINNDLFLLHSTMDGELFNKNWKQVLMRNPSPYSNQDIKNENGRINSKLFRFE